MIYKSLAEGITLECTFAEATDAYSRGIDALLGPNYTPPQHPKDNHPLECYGNVRVVVKGYLITEESRLPELKPEYSDSFTISGEDLTGLYEMGIYYVPSLITSRNGEIVWREEMP